MPAQPRDHVATIEYCTLLSFGGNRAGSAAKKDRLTPGTQPRRV